MGADSTGKESAGTRPRLPLRDSTVTGHVIPGDRTIPLDTKGNTHHLHSIDADPVPLGSISPLRNVKSTEDTNVDHLDST